jgi:hypothetical protein
MAKFLKKFETQAAYEAAQSGLILPNVSLTVDNNVVHYNPSTPTPIETRLVCKYNVTSTSEDTELCFFTTNLSDMEIDGGAQQSIVSAYTFDTIGEHTVKYTLTDPTIISNTTFKNCTNLISIELPSSITIIKYDAFKNCEALKRVNSDIDGVFNIPNGITSIDDSAFYRCKSLTSIDIPDSVTSIGNGAFSDCFGLTSVTIGSGVTSIGTGAFQFSSGLTSITVNAITTPSLGTVAFRSTNECPIYVPSASVETYKSATNWSTYASRIQAIP